jgi:hypothetical protein
MAGYQRYNLAALKALLADRVGLPASGIGFWYPNDEFQWALNESLSVWQALTGFWTTSFPLTMTPGTAIYSLPRQITSVKRVTFSGTPLTQTSTPELDLGFGVWESASGTPEFWAPEGVNLIAIHPTTTGTVVVEGFSDAPWLNTDADYIDIGDDDLEAILGYCGGAYLTFKEGGQELEAAKPSLQSLIAQGAEKNGRLRASAFYRKSMGLDHEAEQRRVSTPTPPGARA